MFEVPCLNIHSYKQSTMVYSVVIVGLTLEAEINYLPVEALVNCSPIKPSLSHFRELEIHICGLASKGALVPPAEHQTHVIWS
jgi:hypothetical protein